MNAEKRAPLPLDKRVEKMDMELKEHFAEFREFVSESLAGLEARLTKRFGERLDERLGDVEKRLDARIDGVEQRLTARLDGVDNRLDGIDSRLDGIDNRLAGMSTAMRDQFIELHAKLDALTDRRSAGSRRRTPARKRSRRRH